MMRPGSIDARLDRTLAALADPTRRAILERLSLRAEDRARDTHALTHGVRSPGRWAVFGTSGSGFGERLPEVHQHPLAVDACQG